MFEVYGWIIAIGIMLIQLFLSRRTNVYWGAIIPVLYLVYIFNWVIERVGKVNMLTLILIAVGGLAILFDLWISGREYSKKKRKKESEKIALQDLN